MQTERLDLSDHELSQPAAVLSRGFVQRWDLYAVQLDDGRYVCVHEQLNVGHLFSHLRGEITLGTYVLDRASRARFLVLDADDEESHLRLGRLARALDDESVPSYLEESRRGGHLWLFLDEATAACDVRAFGKGLLAAHDVEGVELFPKQDRLAGGPGSLIRMPFGVHRMIGRRYGFHTIDGFPLAPTIREQILVLRAPETVPEARFEFYKTFVSSSMGVTAPEPPEEPADTVSERIKASMTVLEFISQYVELKTTASGALGLCPFHDDHNPSLGISDEGNYWHCFADCGGGSVIDFWMKWKGCDFSAAVKELADVLL